MSATVTRARLVLRLCERTDLLVSDLFLLVEGINGMTRLAEYRLYRKFFSGHSAPDASGCANQNASGCNEAKDEAQPDEGSPGPKFVRITKSDIRRPCAPAALAQLLTTIGNSSNPRLHELNLDGCGLAEDNGKVKILRVLFAANWIVSLSLQHNLLDSKVTYLLADLLTDNHFLQRLDLSHNNLGDDGVSTLCDAIGHRNQGLIQVDLSYNNIGSAGAKSIADAIRKNTRLEAVTILGNNFGPAEISQLSAAVAQSGNVHSLVGLQKGVTAADMTGRRMTTADLIIMTAELDANRSITELILRDSNLQPSSVPVIVDILSSNPTLHTLDLGGHNGVNSNVLGADGMQHLSKMLRTNENITTLNLSGCVISNAGMVFSGTDTLWTAMTLNRALIRLDLSSNELGSCGSGISNLLRRNRTLTELRVSYASLNDNDVSLIAKALAKQQALRVLTLAGNQISAACAPAIAEMISTNRKLVELDLANNSLGREAYSIQNSDHTGKADLSATVEGAKAIANALRSNNTLMLCDISGNHISLEGSRLIFAVRKRRTLKLDFPAQLLDVSISAEDLEMAEEPEGNRPRTKSTSSSKSNSGCRSS